MKKALLLLLAVSLAVSGPAWAAKAKMPDTVDTVTGADWLIMSGDERTAYLAKAMKFLESKGIPLRRNAAFYGSQLNVWCDQPGADKALVINLLTTTVYKDDPRTHTMINKMRNKPQASKAAAPAQPRRQVI